MLKKLCLVQTFGFFQYYFGYLDKSYAAFMMGQELDELGEFDNEFVENISKFWKFIEHTWRCMNL